MMTSYFEQAFPMYITKNESSKCMYARNFPTPAPNLMILFYVFVTVRKRFTMEKTWRT